MRHDRASIGSAADMLDIRQTAANDRRIEALLLHHEIEQFDRAFALEKTAMFAPRYLRHVVGNLQVLGPEVNGEVRARANYVVLQVLFDRPDAKLHQIGVYHDKFRRVNDQLKLAERRCVYDSLLVDNALCIPV
jgi:anthranilate 1,2-dioxygenase small subunit